MLKEQATGLVKRLLPSNTPIKVFATYRHSDEVCGIAFSYSENLKVSIDSFLNLKELYVQLYLDAAYKSNKLLIIQLTKIYLHTYVIVLLNPLRIVRQSQKL